MPEIKLHRQSRRQTPSVAIYPPPPPLGGQLWLQPGLGAPPPNRYPPPTRGGGDSDRLLPKPLPRGPASARPSTALPPPKPRTRPRHSPAPPPGATARRPSRAPPFAPSPRLPPVADSRQPAGAAPLRGQRRRLRGGSARDPGAAAPQPSESPRAASLLPAPTPPSAETPNCPRRGPGRPSPGREAWGPRQPPLLGNEARRLRWLTPAFRGRRRPVRNPEKPIADHSPPPRATQTSHAHPPPHPYRTTSNRKLPRTRSHKPQSEARPSQRLHLWIPAHETRGASMASASRPRGRPPPCQDPPTLPSPASPAASRAPLGLRLGPGPGSTRRSPL